MMRRLLMAAALLFVVSALSFVLVSVTPGDPARAILGIQASPEAYDNLREEMGLNLPLYERYWHWLRQALAGDLGISIFTGEPVTRMIVARLPVTASLIAWSVLVSAILGVGLGAFSAVRGGVVGRAVDAFALIGFALPSFWIGAVLISILSVRVRLLPAAGYVPLDESAIDWFRSLVLPVFALSLGGIAALAKQTREAMLDVLSSEYIRVAWANGIRARSIYMTHAFKNAAVRVATILGVQAVGMLGGTVVVENLFALPGLGTLAISATVQHDLPVVQGVVLYFTVMVVVINLLIDLAYTWLNPRVHIE
jgi:peptide/nickel transport system permease protein